MAIKVTGSPTTAVLADAMTASEVTAFATLWARAGEVLALVLPSPPKLAVRLWAPAVNAVVRVACPAGLSSAVPSTVAPSRKVTEPVGIATPGATTVTVAVKVTGWPVTVGFTGRGQSCGRGSLVDRLRQGARDDGIEVGVPAVAGRDHVGSHRQRAGGQGGLARGVQRHRGHRSRVDGEGHRAGRNPRGGTDGPHGGREGHGASEDGRIRRGRDHDRARTAGRRTRTADIQREPKQRSERDHENQERGTGGAHVTATRRQPSRHGPRSWSTPF